MSNLKKTLAFIKINNFLWRCILIYLVFLYLEICVVASLITHFGLTYEITSLLI